MKPLKLAIHSDVEVNRKALERVIRKFGLIPKDQPIEFVEAEKDDSKVAGSTRGGVDGGK